MVKRVRGSDGLIVEFPDDTDEATINSVMAQRHTEYEARQAAGNQQMGAAPQQRQTLVPRNYPTFRQQRPGEIPSPEYERARRALDERALPRNGLGDFTNQIVRNLGIGDEIDGAGAYVSQSADNLIARVRGRQPGISPSVVARAAVDRSREQRNDYARNNPGLNNLSIAASIPTAAGAPVLNAPRLTMLQGGALAAGINAPFALGRQEGSLQERLPGAAQETAIVGGAGTALTGLANAFLRSPGANSMASRAQQFEEAGVRPTMAAISRPEGVAVSRDPGALAGITKPISENFIAGARVRGHLRNSIADTQQSAERIARGYGPAASPETTGAQVQAGLRRFAMGEGAGPQRAAGAERNWSFDQRSNEIYARVHRNIDAAWRQVMQSGRTPPPASTQATAQVIDDILGRNSPEVAGMVSDDVLHQFRDLVSRGNLGGRTFQDLRDLRTYVRNLQQQDASLRPTLSDASLQRLEAALTDDLYRTLNTIGGPRLARELQNADRYYRVGSERIQQALRPFLRNTTSPRQAYEMIIRAASDGGSQNTRMLVAARQSLQPHEWRQVAASAIDEMGRARAGHPYAAEGAFSVEQFATRYNAMSPAGRQALFGDLGSVQGQQVSGSFIDLERALNNLARVAGMQKGVEAAANTSRSAVSAQNLGSLAGLLNPSTAAPTASLLFGAGITGEMLTNPAFVRWIVSAAKSGGGSGGIRQHLGGLSRLAAQDPALAPYYDALAQRVADQSRAPASQPAESALQ